MAHYEIDTKRQILKDVTTVSASGSRQVVPIARYDLDAGLSVNAILCNPRSEPKKSLGSNINETLALATDEPPTINTVTYGMLIQGLTYEDSSKIMEVVKTLKEPEGGYGQFNAFTLFFLIACLRLLQWLPGN